MSSQMSLKMKRELLAGLLRAESKPDAHPLSEGQKGLWFLHQIAPDSHAYNSGMIFRVSSEVNVVALERAFQIVVDRHDSLRTVLDTVHHSPVQRIPARIPVPFEHIRTAPDQLEQEATAYFRRPFDLHNGPVCRFALISASERDHMLVFTTHHIVVDGWSQGIIFEDFIDLYQQICDGTVHPIPKATVQYVHFVKWQAAVLAGARGAELRNEWLEVLEGLSAPAPLLHENRKMGVDQFSGGSIPLNFTPKLINSLKTLAMANGATLYGVLLSALSILIQRYTGENEIIVGVPMAARNRPEFARVVGFFTNTVPVRNSLAGNPTFRELLNRTGSAIRHTLTLQDYPYPLLVREKTTDRAGTTDLFRTLFNYQDLSRFPNLFRMLHGAVEVGGLVLDIFRIPQGEGQYDLTIDVVTRQDGLEGTLKYNTGALDKEEARRFAAQYLTLLEDIAAHPEQSIRALNIVPPEDRERLAEWNATEVDYPPEQTLQAVFERHARETPDRIAVTDGDAQFTYGELNARANRIAHYLRAHQLGRGELVGICTARGFLRFAGLIGILKAGGAYVPLDAGYPALRLQGMAADCRMRLLVADEPAARVLPALQGVTVVNLEADDSLSQYSDDNPAAINDREDPAYVTFTSGSTGKPKGAILPHRGVLRLILCEPSFAAEPDAVCLQLSPFTFDASVLETWAALLTGGRCVTFPDGIPSPREIGTVVEQHHVKSMFLTAALFNAVVDDFPSSLRDMQLIFTGGDVCSPRHLQRAAELMPRTRIVNIYGPTETSVYATAYVAPFDFRWDGQTSVSIGTPVANTQIHILDEAGRCVAIGVFGELYIGGDGVGLGYAGREDLTQARFLPDYFRPGQAGARLYRTGDIARFLADGNIEFRGRTDDQVKIRGFRIELTEIELVMATHPLVKEVVVIARESPSGDKQLVAYVAAPDATPAFRTELRSFLQERLPDYMVPRACVVLDELPHNVNGKVEKRALPDVGESSPVDATRYAPPRNHLELQLVRMWESLLYTLPVGIHDNFFDAGGHSLTATQLVSHVRAEFGVDLPLRAVFEAPTIAEFSRYLQQPGNSESDVIARRERTGSLALSFAQQRLWFLDQLAPGSAAYNICTVLTLRGSLDIAALECSIAALIARHEALRTSFRTTPAGAAEQVVADSVSFRLERIDASTMSEEEIEGIISAECRRPIDISQAPLLRCSLLRQNEGQHLLFISIHHIVADGWSMRLFYAGLKHFYEGFSGENAGAASLPEVAIQYADFSEWQQKQMASGKLDTQLAYWKRHLAGAPALLELPATHRRPALQSFRGCSHGFTIPAATTAALRKLSRREGTTLYMTLLAAFSTLLHRYTGQEDIVVGSPIANRNHRDTEDTFGMFVNTLPVRTAVSGAEPFRAVLQRVKATAFEAYANQDVPLEKMLDLVHVKRDPSYSPLFQTVFVFQEGPEAGFRLGKTDVSVREVPTGTSKFDLTLFISDSGAALQAGWEYASDLFDDSAVRRMSAHLLTLLEDIVSHPDELVGKLSLLTAGERKSLIEAGIPEPPACRADCTLARWFERQVAQTPEAVALTFEDRRLTYAELNALANRLARYLRAKGVGPETLVALRTERSPDMLVGILGILKAGGAYLPIDVLYPPERVSFMLEDASVQVVLTQVSLLASMPQTSAQVICLDRDWSTIAAESSENPIPLAKPSNLAYVIYTSGSTGKPKGCLVTHANVVRLMQATEQWFHFDSRDVWTLFHSHAFDFSVWEIWGALLYGGRLVVVPYLVSRSPDQFHELLRTQGVTVLNQTPSAFRQLLTADAAAGERISSLRTVIFGGEALELAMLRPWFARYGDEQPRVVNMYGITETTVHVTYRPITKADVEAGTGSVIGGPIPDLQVYILDAFGAPSPVGIPGEIHVGGAGVARGYLNRPELTAARFIPDPFSSDEGARLYRSGDLARRLPNGDVEYLGRIDQQVKIRGFRIELGEIEDALNRCPGIKECAVIAREDGGNKRLVAYIIAEADQPPGTAELVRLLKLRLPDYMIPSAFVTLTAFPLTSNGKLDKAALPVPENRIETSLPYTPPANAIENLLATTWAEVLGVERIGVHDNFFDAGGNSLLVVQAHAKIRVQFGRELPVVRMFQYPTVATLARWIAGEQETDLKVVRNRADKQKQALAAMRGALGKS